MHLQRDQIKYNNMWIYRQEIFMRFSPQYVFICLGIHKTFPLTQEPNNVFVKNTGSLRASRSHRPFGQNRVSLLFVNSDITNSK